MNKINFQQTGGFPLETDTLNYMQEAYKTLQAITGLGGDNFILSGCIVAGSNVGNGYIVINGEVLEFRGGVKQTNIIIREEIAQRPFENGQIKDVFFTRYAGFGTGDGAINFDSLSRLKTLVQLKDLPTTVSSAIDFDREDSLATSKAVKLLNDKINANVPRGVIWIWSGAINAVPDGFALCNGDNGTPDLRSRFVYGAGLGYGVGDTGGSEIHVLKIEEIPPHTHTYKKKRNGSANGNTDGHPDNTEDDAQTGSAGGGLPHNNMPPYLALAYIMKL